MTSNRSQSDLQRSLLRRSTRYASASLLLGGTILVSGCLDRPIGNSRPVTTNVVIQRQINNAINAIDLLLMIDNSSSMADKQKVLADAVPQLLTQLVQPNCVDADGKGTGTRVTLGTGACPTGSSPEFNPVNNIHIGIVTSSLGDHGGGVLCTPGVQTSFTDASGNVIAEPDDVNDKGHLVGTLARYSSTTNPTTNVTVDATGFLAWGDSKKPPMTDPDLTAATGIFKDMVIATHEMGCGLEAQLEGWYRFLIDPVPPTFPIKLDGGSQAQRIGSDDAVLAQRAAFLRPDSLVAILMLTDENDCSLRDTDVGWVATNTKQSIATGSSQCDANPNDPCCYSCTNSTPPGNCSNGCPNGAANAKDDTAYQANIRCWHQKRRFGYEFMYPTSRYVVGLTNPTLCPDQSFGDMDCDCVYANSIHAACNPGTRKLPNPLYGSVVGTDNEGNPVNSVSSGIPRTDNSVIFLAGIVGVPWQDIGYKDSASGALVYIPVTDASWSGAAGGLAPIKPPPAGTSIWDNIYADDNDNGKVPADPHMIEALQARDGITAYDNIEKEWNTAYQDLEYACVFPLPQSKPCACDSTKSDYASCKYLNPNDCCDLSFSVDGRGDANSGGNFNKPLCTGNTQVNAKGYPGLREIGVLHDYAVKAPVAGNSIVASICPADVQSTDTKAAGYGYNPAVAALVTRLKEKLKGSCLPRPLQVKGDGTVPCSVVEVVSMKDMSGCDTFCKDNGRSIVASTDPMRQAVLESMKNTKLCDAVNNSPCTNMCLCELNQEQKTSNVLNDTQWGSDLDVCQNADEGTVDQLDPGYCYVDPDLLDANGDHVAGTNEALVSSCPSTQRRILRFAGNNPSGVSPSGLSGVLVPLSGAMVYTACQGSSLSD